MFPNESVLIKDAENTTILHGSVGPSELFVP